MMDFWLKVLSGVLVSLIATVIVGAYKLVQRVSKLEINWDIKFQGLQEKNDEFEIAVNKKLERIFAVNDAQLEALNAIMIFIKHGIKNGEIDAASEKLKSVTYSDRTQHVL